MQKMVLSAIGHFITRVVWSVSLVVLVAALLSASGCRAMQNQVAAPRDNAKLAREVAEQIYADGRAAGAKVGISVDAGAVVLYGQVPTETQAVDIFTSAVTVPGVRHVDNRLRVEMPAPDGSKNRRTLIEDVREALEASLPVRGNRLLVESEGGVVYLSGIVPTPQTRSTAVTIAMNIPGVRQVEDNLMSETR